MVFFSDMDVNKIEYLAIINDEYFIVVYKSYNLNQFGFPDKENIMLVVYSYKGKEKERVYLEEEPLSYHNHSEHLILVYQDKILYTNDELQFILSTAFNNEFIGVYEIFHQGQAFVNGIAVDQLLIEYPGNYNIQIVDDDYSFNQDITVNPIINIVGDRYNDYYLGSVVISSLGQLYLNDVEYHSKDKIETPGNYHLVVIGENDYCYEEFFIIYPVITYFNGEESGTFIENMKFESFVKIYSNAISMSLDGEPYDNQAIDEVGQHFLTVYGVNSMKFDIWFSILPTYSIKRVSSSEVILTVLGEGLLNDERISGEVLITNPGDYTFSLLNGNEIIETVFFVIENQEVIEDDTNITQEIFSYVFLGIIVIGCYFILRKK